jgi:phenylacetate-CoA ligase
VTGEPLPDGEFGELVFTTLTKEGLPMIRYRTRDLTRLLPPTARSMRRMDKIMGRSDDMIILRGVNVFPSQIEELICKDDRFAPQFQIVLTRDGPLDRMTVRVEANPASAGAFDRAACSRDLSHRIKSIIGISAVVEMLDPDTVERSLTGKVKRVRDLRPKE